MAGWNTESAEIIGTSSRLGQILERLFFIIEKEAMIRSTKVVEQYMKRLGKKVDKPSSSIEYIPREERG
jgi:hypothetical protein